VLAAAVTGKRKAALVELPDLEPKDEFVVVKVHSAPMCTEYGSFEGGHERVAPGHEAAGEVVAIDKSTRVKVGDRVVVMPQYPCGKCELCLTGDYIHCEHNRDVTKIIDSYQGTGTMAQYLVKQDWLLVPIPDGMSYDHGSMACCGLGPTFGAVRLMDAQPGDTVLITGLGPVGLGGVINCRYRSCRVIGVDNNTYRADLARKLGAEAVIDPADPDALQKVRDLTSGRGADKAIACTPVPSAHKFAIDATRRRGHVAFVGWTGEISVDAIIGKGLTIHGAWHYNLAHATKVMKIIAETPDQMEKLITHRFPMKDAQKAWELQLSGRCGKVVLHPWE